MLSTNRLLLLVILALALTGCAMTPQSDFSHDGLELREVQGLDEVWVRPGIDFSTYRNMIVEPVEVAFDPSWNPQRTGSRLRLSEKEREDIRSDAAALFDRTLRQELAQSQRFDLVDIPGPNTLTFTPRIIDLIINAPNDRNSATLVRTYVSEFGRVTLVGELIDTESGAVVARIADREVARAIPPLEFTHRFTNEREGERIVQQWARALIEEIDDLGSN